MAAVLRMSLIFRPFSPAANTAGCQIRFRKLEDTKRPPFGPIKSGASASAAVRSVSCRYLAMTSTCFGDRVMTRYAAADLGFSVTKPLPVSWSPCSLIQIAC